MNWLIKTAKRIVGIGYVPEITDDDEAWWSEQ